MNKRKQEHLRIKYGPWAVVTGASDGIGRAIAETLAEAEFNLVLVARRRSVLEELAQDWTSRFDIETCVIDADLGQPDGIKRVLEETTSLDTGLFVAGAGFGTSGNFVENAIDQELAMIDVNCRSVVEMTHHYANRFIERKRGGIILFSSLVAFQGVQAATNYAATKAFIQSFVEGLARELAPLGIDVLASAPGPVDSGFAARANMQMGVALTPAVVAEGTLAALGHKTTVRPGFLSKFLELSLSFLPHRGRVWAMSQVMKGMTAHHHDQLQKDVRN
jgi:hypothetical protein